ncbi:hypothetical protein TNCV_3989751 [Trichonephila clavipes]|uniref:Uncharacterized protein n=1 Tax=Trichonephila clavipes TaxID=2585209 RepID=A0A8X6T5V8_TRICX|nr:hypothetical protein TNCV_3989751 [Trichonephila clavipes]
MCAFIKSRDKLFAYTVINLLDPAQYRNCYPHIEVVQMPNGGHGSLVVKVMDSWLACHEFEPSAAEDPPID